LIDKEDKDKVEHNQDFQHKLIHDDGDDDDGDDEDVHNHEFDYNIQPFQELKIDQETNQLKIILQ